MLTADGLRPCDSMFGWAEPEVAHRWSVAIKKDYEPKELNSQWAIRHFGVVVVARQRSKVSCGQ